uniref:Uncharacterized protein n=1 Tax=Arundo donax TaxID=35708 RepID=A0A0A9GV32_ARUDO
MDAMYQINVISLLVETLFALNIICIHRSCFYTSILMLICFL